MPESLIQTLKECGWTEIKEDWEYHKEDWLVLRDTSLWWIIGTASNPRVFDVLPKPLLVFAREVRSPTNIK
ncbi:MAG: hypothetical protein HYR67_05075 [Bacteroidetes bacterium]|nr:hypothetical protein [Bacteroidota bacterium]